MSTFFILGCGPSLRGFDANVLRGRGTVMVINDSFILAPWADHLYFCDQKWFTSRQDRVLEMFAGQIHRMVRIGDTPSWGVTQWPCDGELGMGENPFIRHGSNSGYQAIQIATHLDAKRIVLLGYDMRVDGQRMHWNERPEPQEPVTFAQMLERVMLPKFETLVAPLADAGVEVLNATPGSALKCWPMVALDDVLENTEVLQ